jgi:hypothetical protein
VSRLAAAILHDEAGVRFLEGRLIGD